MADMKCFSKKRIRNTISIVIAVILVLLSVNAYGQDFEPYIQSKVIKRLDWLPKPEMGYNFALGREYNQEIFPYYSSNGTTDILLEPNTGELTILKLDKKGNITGSIQIEKELNTVGAFTEDEKGNIFVLYGQNTDFKEEESIRLVKYSSGGKREAALSFSQAGIDTVKPFDSGCSMTVQQGRGVILFGRLIDSAHVGNDYYGVVSGLRHQGSCTIFVDTDKMETLSKELSGVSHSLSQLTFYDDGLYYCLERGDASPRAFDVTIYNSNGSRVNEWQSFKFKSDAKKSDKTKTETINGNTYVPIITYSDINNNTFSIAGDIVNMNGQNWLTGAYENTTDDRIMSPRNLFIQKMTDNSQPVYLTHYTDYKTAEVGAVRAAVMENGNTAILYEENKFTGLARNSNIIYGSGFDKDYEHNSIHLLEIDSRGNVLNDYPMSVPDGVYLSCFDRLSYNKADRTFRWVTYNGRNLTFNLIDLNSKKIPEKIETVKKTSADFADTATLSESDRKIVDWGLANGVVSGSSDGLFHPWDFVSRAEFAVMAVRSYGFNLSQPQGIFSDVPKDYWACQYIEALAREGAIPSGGSFRPESPVTREEADKIIVLASHLNENINMEKSGGEKVYSQISANCGISAYYLGNNRELKRISAVQMFQTSSNILEVYYDRLSNQGNGIWQARYSDGRILELSYVNFVPKN